jgi:cellulose synthase/poly-beta-1,6-N-acetylglucosamine synthase-like glycosyltransferase
MAFQDQSNGFQSMILSMITIALAIIYILLLILYRSGWVLQQTFVPEKDCKPVTGISVVIAARNEEQNIAACLQSLSEQNYPAHLFELIVVDDFSTDKTAEIVAATSAPNVRLLRLADYVSTAERIHSYKKKALATGILHSSGELIVTSDADCVAGRDWLGTIAAYYEQYKPAMIVAPVRFKNDFSLVQQFQSLDFMTMQGITVATVRLSLGIMCNGANLAFSRKAYDMVDGYAGVDHLVSGDDYLLQMKIKQQYADGVHYLKSGKAIVDTLPQPDWSAFLQQRIRWASKTGKYKDIKTTAILLFIYFFNCSLATLFIYSWFHNHYFVLLLKILIVKIIGELLFLYAVSDFFGKKKELLLFPFLQPLHILYIILAGFLSKVGKFEWKQRSSSNN